MRIQAWTLRKYTPKQEIITLSQSANPLLNTETCSSQSYRLARIKFAIMKKTILSLLIAVAAIGAVAPTAAHAQTTVVVVNHRHHKHPHANMVWVPGHWQGRFWRRAWVPGHWVPA